MSNLNNNSVDQNAISNKMPNIVAEVYTYTNDLEDLKENLEIMLHCAGFEGTEINVNSPSSQAQDFENSLSNMERQGELTGIEKSRLINLYKNNDPRVVGIWESHKINWDYTDFSESLLLFLGAASLSNQNTENKKGITRRKSYKKTKNKEPPLFQLQQMSIESEEFEEEEEEEESENSNEYWDKNQEIEQEQNIGNAYDENDDQVRDVFIEQQHRIIKRFCLNAKIPIADGAKFHQMINDCDQRIISSFEVFALNRNEEDFLENLGIVYDIIKAPLDLESPENKSVSMNGFSPQNLKDSDQQEKKLIELEPMEGSESKDDQNGENIEESHNFQQYIPEDQARFVELLEDFKDSFDEEDINEFQTMIRYGNMMIMSILESYSIAENLEDAVDSLTILLNQVKR